MSRRSGEEKDSRFWLANIAGALLLAEGARVIAKADACSLAPSSPALGLSMLPGVMMLNRLPLAGVVGMVASLHGFVLSPSKALDNAKSWPWPILTAGICGYLMTTKQRH
mmetsp:Transcript_88051/g.254145  ORF Transcript_88051/g.254145 Transcript_88051/m.254145 type:complete len:110 (-) Transcript_88051:90-419(-)